MRALPAGRSTVSPSSRPGERRKRKMPRHPTPPFVTFRKTSPDKPILDQERTGSESGHRTKQPWPVPAQNPPSPVVSAPRIGQAHRLSAIPRPETVCQPATQHFRQKETDKREQAAEQTDESPIAYDRNTKARPRRCRQHVLVPTAGTRRSGTSSAGNHRETVAKTHTENRPTNRKIRHAARPTIRSRPNDKTRRSGISSAINRGTAVTTRTESKPASRAAPAASRKTAAPESEIHFRKRERPVVAQ